jgi:hypothetical protein
LNFLFLSVTDQRKHPLGRYVDLHINYDFNNWIDGFAGVGHSFIIYDYYKHFVECGTLLIESDIEKLVKENSINIVIIPNLYYEIGVEFINKLRNIGVKSVVVFFDDSSRFEIISRFYVGLCDYIVTHESKHALRLYEPYQVDVSFFPCFPSINHYKQILLAARDTYPNLNDVSFVGANIADRSEFIRKLKDLNISVSMFGVGWPLGRISQEAMLQIFRDSKISLNFTKSGAAAANKQLKARAFEIVLAGGFLLTEYDEELCNYFEVGKEIDVFTTAEECAEKIFYYLNNQDARLEMQRLASQKCKSTLNFEHAWSAYLGKIQANLNVDPLRPCVNDLPKFAINGFINWNTGIVIGRLRIGQVRLAFDQFFFAVREINYLSSRYSGKVWLIFGFFIIKMPFTILYRTLSKIALLRSFIQKIKEACS